MDDISKRKKKMNKPVKKGVAKTPVIMQMEALECGAASLAMILAYYDLWIPLEKVRLDCGVSRDGSCAKNVILAARNYGLLAKAFKMEPETLAEKGQFPCIVHWEFDHFIVVNGIRKGKVYINDPGRGSVVMSMDQFSDGFTGICLFFEPGEEFEPGGQKVSMLKYSLKRLNGLKMAITFVVLTTVISSLIGIILPGFERVFMDHLLSGKDPEWAPYFLGGLVVMSLLQIIVEWIQAIFRLRIDGKLAAVGNTSYLWKVLHMPMEFFSQRFAGDIQMRQTSNATIASTMMDTLAPIAIKAVMMVFYLIVMFRYSVTLSIIGLSSIVVNFLMSRIISAKRVNITRVSMRDEGKLASMTVSGIEMIETIKASGAENGYFEKWAGYQANVNAQQVKFVKLEHYIGLIPQIVSSLADILVLYIGILLVCRGQFTIGMIMAFQGFLQQFAEPATSLINAGQTIMEMRTDMERIEDVMQYPTDVDENEEPLDENVDYQKLSGQLSMKDVTFGYSILAAPLITDFNLELKPGKSVAFVGSSGCGKSTLAKLISGLYKPWSGEITFDGVPLKDINHRVFTGSLAVVDQDITMFEDTLANNIKMWDDSIENFEVIMAAKDAQIHDSIAQRKGGYDYKLTEGGKDFSGGERQRMELARVLAQDPTIIILDEATSALDARTEYEAVKAIKDRGVTCIVVAHRLSTIRHCDEIIVLDHGQVVERGTHEELYANGGLYTELVSNE